jgi:TP901 family phage tail tape measure protein
MSDINTNISVNIDTSGALGQLKALQRQISTFHTSIAKSSQTASLAQADLQKNFLNAVNGIGAFSAELRTVKTSAENFTSSLEKNKFSMREYFRYAGGATQTFGRLFRSEFETINKVATENVKNLQTQYIKMGRDANGAMKAIAVRPLTLDMQNLSTQTQIAAQKQALFNQLVKQGSTNLLNFGKNTQWAGRQLMVGFTLPLMALGTAASKTFMEMEAAALKFKKVYGDLFTAPEETQAALDGITELAQGFTQYGIAVSKTIGLASEAAAAGFAGVDLQRQTTAATKLSVLGQIEQQQALETTISLQNAMGISSQELATSIDFLNAVENQTVTSLDDITIAIPKVAPVIKSLGGDVKDLAFFMTAMKEGGINASEGANALKSGLASMINPAKKSAAMLADMGININGIVEKNRGNLRATVVEFAQALDRLDPLSRARAIEQMFGKFQFARLSTLFQNVIKDGTQAERVLQLAGSSVEELAALSDKELGMTADSAMNKFKKSVEDLKFALVPVGKVFLEVITPFLEKISGLIERFNNLSDSTKKIITLVTVGIGAIAPVVLMTIGLLANFVANGIKGLMILRNGYLRLTGQSQILGEQTNYLTVEQQQALAAAHSLEQSHARLVQTFTVESTALGQLKNAYIAATTAANNFAMKNPGMMVAPVVPTKRATGKPAVVGGTGNRDTELALLTPGETVIPAPMSEKYGSLINGMIADNIPGYNDGLGANVNASFIASMGARVSPDANNRSRLALEKYLAEEIAKITNRVGPELVGDFRVFMESTASEMQKVTKSSLDKALKEQRVILEQYSPASYNLTEGQQFAHIGSGIKTTASRLQASGALTHQKSMDKLAQLASVLPDKEVGIKTGFGFDIMARLNNLMGSTGANLQEVIREFNTNGINKWKTMIKIGGGNFDALAGQLQRYDGEVSRLLQQRLNSGATTIVDTNAELEQARAKAIAAGQDFDQTVYVVMEEIDIQARSNLEMLGTELNNVIQTALSTITEIRLNLTAQEDALLGGNFMGVSNGAPRLSGRIDASGTKAGRKLGGYGQINPALQAAAIQSTDELIETIQTTAGVQSPSRRTIPIGQDIARGLEVGIKKEIPSVQAVADNMIDAAVNGSRRASRPAGAPFPVAPAGATMLPIVPADVKSTRVYRGASAPQGPAPIGPATPSTASLLPIIAAPLIRANQAVAESTQEIVEINNKQKAAMELSSGKLASMNKTLNSTTFALTAMAGAGSMFGGRIGDLSAQVFKYSGLMFGLMQITQLLTQAQFARLVAERAATNGILIRNVTEATGAVTFTRATGLFAGGIKKLIPNIFNLSKKIIGMLGPWGRLAAIAATIAGALWGLKKVADAQKEKIDGLGNAAFIAGDRLKTLADIFGVVPQKFAFESLPKTVGVGMTGQERTAVDKVRESEDFQKDYAKNIAAIRDATDQQAELLFKGLVIQLRGRGFAEEQVQAIVNAIKIESGKTEVELDFKTISILTPEGRKAVQKDIISLVKLAKTTREIKALAGTLAGIIGATQIAFETGAISAQDYADQMSFINKQIASMPQPKAIAATEAIFNSMDSTGVLAKTAAGITNINDRLLVLNAVALAGVGPDSPLIKGLSSTLFFVRETNRSILQGIVDSQIAKTTSAVAAAAAAAAKLNKTNLDGGKELSALSKKVIEGLKKELKVLEDKKKALEAVNDEIERQQEFQEKQQQLDADMVQAKISGNYIQAALLGQQKLYNKSQYDRETSELKLDQQIQKLQDRIDALENGAKVTELDKKLANIENKVSSATKPTKKTSGTTTAPKKDDKKTTTPKIEYAPEPAAKTRTIPSYLPALSAVLKKRGPGSAYTVAFDPGSGNWVEVKIGSIPKKYITKEQWNRGTKQYANGGVVRNYSLGSPGGVSGPGTSTSDSIPALLSDGEYVFSAKAVDAAGGPGIVDGWHKALRRAKGGPVGANKFSLGKPDPKQSVLNNFLFGQKYIGGNSDISKSEIPFGPGGISKIIAKLGYKPVNLFNQYMNYFKAKKMVKSGMFHGSADLGRNSDGPFSGTTKLVGDYGNDPYHGMGFYATSSKSEADMYAGGYNVLGQWGESYGSMNKVTKLPFGKYLDFTKDLKAQNYGMWEMFQSQRDKGFLGAHEKLGSIMNDAGMTGAIMPRISSGMGPEEIMLAKWIALNKPKGTMLEEIGLGFSKEGKPKKFHAGGPVGHTHSGAPHDLGMSSMGQGGAKKQNWFQRYVSNLTKAHDSNPAWARDPLGSVALLRKIAGQSRKGDSLSAAMMPLNFFGMGLAGKAGLVGKVGVAGNAATSSTKVIKSTKASTIIMRNLHNAMVESATSSGRQVPNLTAPDTLKLSTSMLDEASDHGAAFRKYWGKAYEILAKSKNPVIDGMSQDDFFKSIVGNSETAMSRWKGSGFGLSSGPSASQIDSPSDFIKAANAAYLQAHGLSSSQSLAMFRAVRAPGNYDSYINSAMMSDPSLTPEQIFSSSIAHELGGYWSLSSKMGASYLRNLGITRSSLAGKPYGGLYRADVPADAFPTPIGMGGMMDEYANVFNPATIDSLRSATRIGSGWENLLKGPKRSTVLSNFYKTAPIPAKGQIAPEALEKLKTILSDSELRQLLKMMKDSSAGRSISLSAPFMSAPMAGSRWNEHEGLTHMMNLIRKAEEALGQSILIPKMANGGMVRNKISGANYKLPSYDVGIGYVPEDQIAQLHKGERVLTAEENKNFTTSGDITNNIYINGSDLNKKEIAEAVMVELDRAQKKNNKTNMVNK